MIRTLNAPVVFLVLACATLAACEGANFDDPQPRPNLYGGRGAGAGGG